MKEVRIKLNGKEYAKTRPTVYDLREMAEYQKAMRYTDENGVQRRRMLALDEEAQQAAFRHIASYVGAPDSQIADTDDLFDLFEALRAIDANIAEALTGEEPGKNAEGR